MAQRVDLLIAAGYVREGGSGESSGGRPPSLLEFDGSGKIVLGVVVEATQTTAAMVTVAGTIVRRIVIPVAVDEGPHVVLGLVRSQLASMFDADGVDVSAVCGIGVAVPAPVEHVTGRPIEPTVMPGWHDCPIREELEGTFGLPVYVDNDANVMAIAEYSQLRPNVDTMLYIRASDGIGAGLIIDGRLYRGTVGAAGAVGHTAVDGSNAICTCGNVGCVGAVASGRAVAARLRESGVDVAGAGAIVDLARSGHQETSLRLRAAGRDLGRVLAGVVNLLDPGAVIIGGEFSDVPEFLAGIREEAYRRALPLAAGHLQIGKASLGADASIIGAALLVAEELLSSRPLATGLI